MNSLMEITYYLHSGFSCAIDSNLLIFDYWLGEQKELDKDCQLTVEKLKEYSNVYVFISHKHPDHFDQIVYEWYPDVKVNYIVSYDMPVGTRGKRMSPGDVYQINEHMSVYAYDSTDLGVSFLIQYDDINIFHAGDLNFWHWRDESTAKEIDEAETQFKKAVEPLTKQKIDIAFFPVDPRQGRMFDAGANYFILQVKPRVMIPMHFWKRTEIAVEFARRCKTRDTEIIALTQSGEKMIVDIEDNNMIINVYKKEVGKRIEKRENQIEFSSLNNNDPFVDSDLPVKLDE